MSKKIKGKEPLNRKKLVLPEVIDKDLTYYMQFGWKQIRPTNRLDREERKYAGTVYRNRYIDDANEY